MTNDELKSRFTYYAPTEDQPVRYERIRNKAMSLAAYINEYCPDSREKSLAFTKLEEAIMWANASIAREEI